MKNIKIQVIPLENVTRFSPGLPPHPGESSSSRRRWFISRGVRYQ
jgi:hypothetical protein